MRKYHVKVAVRHAPNSLLARRHTRDATPLPNKRTLKLASKHSIARDYKNSEHKLRIGRHTRQSTGGNVPL